MIDWIIVGILIAGGLLIVAMMYLHGINNEGEKMMNDQMEQTAHSNRDVKKASQAEQANSIRNNGHEHVFTTGLAPGGKNLRICTVPGCGYTEGL